MWRGEVDSIQFQERTLLAMTLISAVVWLLKSLTYWTVFRFRAISATALNCLIIAGAAFLMALVPLPLPSFVSIPFSIGLAVYLTMHYTRVELIPDGLFIPMGVECVFRVGWWVIQELGILR